jgi:hypothetical protein
MTSDKIIDQYLNSRNLRILREEIEKEMLVNEMANTVSEDLIPITIDFAEARKNILNEDWGLMFGSWIKTLLGGLFQGLDIPATIKGTKSEVDSFAKTLNREKKYIESWRKYGLDNPATYRDKAKLQGSIKDFERTTNIKWPFKD